MHTTSEYLISKANTDIKEERESNTITVVAFVVRVGIELRASCLLDKCSTT
jgi:hypothetical protein